MVDGFIDNISKLFKRLGTEKAMSIVSDKIQEAIDDLDGDGCMSVFVKAKQIIEQEFSIGFNKNFFGSKKCGDIKTVVFCVFIELFPKKTPTQLADIIGPDLVSRQQIWKAQKTYQNLSPKLKHEVAIKEKVAEIITKINNDNE